MKMYEIEEALEKCFDSETGEIIDPLQFEALQGERDDKLEAIGCIIKNREVLINGLKDEKRRITERLAVLERENDGTKRFLDGILQGQKFETPKVRMIYRKSTSVDISDEAKVPDEFVTVVEERKCDKLAIRKALQSGKEVRGCELIERNNLTVK